MKYFWSALIITGVILFLMLYVACENNQATSEPIKRNRFAVECEKPDVFANTWVCVVFDKQTKIEYVTVIRSESGVALLDKKLPEAR